MAIGCRCESGAADDASQACSTAPRHRRRCRWFGECFVRPRRAAHGLAATLLGERHLPAPRPLVLGCVVVCASDTPPYAATAASVRIQRPAVICLASLPSPRPPAQCAKIPQFEGGSIGGPAPGDKADHSPGSAVPPAAGSVLWLRKLWPQPAIAAGTAGPDFRNDARCADAPQSPRRCARQSRSCCSWRPPPCAGEPGWACSPGRRRGRACR